LYINYCNTTVLVPDDGITGALAGYTHLKSMYPGAVCVGGVVPQPDNIRVTATIKSIVFMINLLNLV